MKLHLWASLAYIVAGRPTVVDRDTLLPCYDFIVIGGGTSGLTVADRLTEDSITSVLVVEYGPLDNYEPAVLVPGLLNLTATTYLFNVTSIPQANLGGRSFKPPAGAVVGGRTVVNGMFFDRGAAVDYDAWSELGNPGWDWQHLLPYFEKVSSCDLMNEFTDNDRVRISHLRPRSTPMTSTLLGLKMFMDMMDQSNQAILSSSLKL